MKSTKIMIRGDNGKWEVAQIYLMHEYKQHPLITIARHYKTVTGQEAFDDALKDLNELIAYATAERDAMLSKNPVQINNLNDGKITVVNKAIVARKKRKL